ncbi:MAG: hypothetical protein ACE5GD_00785 [Candidatus Geothermarchaeales archaeon]
MSKYARGAKFERRVKKYFEGLGYLVIRAAGSKPIDLVCIRDGEVLLVECKTSLSEVNKSTRERILGISAPFKARAIVAARDNRRIVLIDAKSSKRFRPTRKGCRRIDEA